MFGSGWDLPEEATPWTDFHWFRVTGKHVLELVILSREPTWYVGHFVRGRMLPCYGQGCKLCSDGVGAQVRFVMAAIDASTNRVGLIEVGKSVGDLIRDWTSRIGGLRGMWIEVSKYSMSKNSRMEVRYIDRKIPMGLLDKEGPDCREALRSTWRKAQVDIPDEFKDQTPAGSFLRGHLAEVRKTR